jgi:hypothetical protein
MKNLVCIQKDFDISFIKNEIEEAIRKERIPEDFGLESMKMLVEQRKAYYGGNFKFAHEDSGWQNLVKSFNQALTKTDNQKLCRDNSKFLYRTSLYKDFPKTLTFLKSFAKEKKAVLQRVHFALLPPGREVTPHIDHGEYYKVRNRYHIVVQSKNGSIFNSGDERATLHEGEMWYMNNKQVHSVKNIGDSPRIHLIFDTLPENHFSLKEKIINLALHTFFESYLKNYGREEFNAMLEKNPGLMNALIGK